MKPIAVMITVRNRLALTKKCIQTLYKSTRRPIHLFVYDNCTSYKIKEHFDYFSELYETGVLQKYVVNTFESTYNAFSKVVAFNEFGRTILENPIANRYEFLVLLDNDMMMVKDNWDDIIIDMWRGIDSEEELRDMIHIVTQWPNGCTSAQTGEFHIGDENYKLQLGYTSGSCFWCFRDSFFKKVGFLNPNNVVGQNKKHDQLYWHKMRAINNHKPYILAVEEDLVVTYDNYKDINLSICDPSQFDPQKEITFKEVDDTIDKMPYDSFMNLLRNNIEQFKP